MDKKIDSKNLITRERINDFYFFKNINILFSILLITYLFIVQKLQEVITMQVKVRSIVLLLECSDKTFNFVYV